MTGGERDFIAVREARAGHFVPATATDIAACDEYGVRHPWPSMASAAAAITRAGFTARPHDGKPEPKMAPVEKPAKAKKPSISAALKKGPVMLQVTAPPVDAAKIMGAHDTREAWLLAGIELMRPWFTEKGHALPAVVRASCGFALGSRKAIGQAWGNELCSDGAPAVFVSPVIANPVRALDILLHELVHVALPAKVKHGRPFSKLAGELGLVKPWTATTASPELKERLNAFAGKLGTYPHSALQPSDRKKQGTRLLKAQCLTCGYTVRITAKWVNEVGEPHCPLHGEMECN